MRLQRFLARAGLASRRGAEELIRALTMSGLAGGEFRSPSLYGWL
jgi:16S rRNA U516 pseudouridylate synthase RsuA-like enzyme